MRRKMRKQPVGRLNPWNFDAEPGDRVIGWDGRVFDLCESRGRDKRASGELTPVLASASRAGKEPVQVDGIWYWES